MESWSIHSFYAEATKELGDEKAIKLQRYAQSLMTSNLPVIFTLGHLAKITHTDYNYLQDTVRRKREAANYKMFDIKKRSGGRRFIHAVNGRLHDVQQFINSELLQKVTPHPASFAFHSSGGIHKCAKEHCEARWLFHFDLKDFFYSVTEMTVYNIFKKLGYSNLLSFELARLCTTTRLPKDFKRVLVHRVDSTFLFNLKEKIDYPHLEKKGIIGVLPQGAPTSPMLANLAAFDLDKDLSEFASQYGFTYTRYADDITISASYISPALSIGNIQHHVIRTIRKHRFLENPDKTRIAGPGSRKKILGLLVDGPIPRLSKETYKRIDRLLHASQKYGLEETAAHEKFESAYGFHNHLSGLVAFVKDVDQKRWEEFDKRLKTIKQDSEVKVIE